MTAAPKALPKWQQKIIGDLWENAIKPRLDAFFATVKVKVADALKAKPAVATAIVAAVAAIDAALLNGGPKPMSDSIRSTLGGVRKAADGVIKIVDRLLEPPKPFSAAMRKVLVVVVTLAGALGIVTRVKPKP